MASADGKSHRTPAVYQFIQAEAASQLDLIQTLGGCLPIGTWLSKLVTDEHEQYS